MDDQDGSARWQELFESALQAYERKTGVILAQHPLTVQLQSCHSAEDITTLLQGRARAFSDFRERDRIMESTKTIVSILNPLSDAFLADAVGLTSFPPAKAIQASLGILLDTANGIITSHDVLADLLESIGRFVNRLKIYAQIAHTPVIDKEVVKLIAELISTLALVTRKLKQRGSLGFVKNYFAVKDIKAARQRLDQLIHEELATTAAKLLEVIHGDVTDMKFMDDVKASAEGIRKVIYQMTSDVNESKRDKLRSDIRSWLSPPDPWKNYDIARELRHGKTGAWFVNSKTLSEWKASGSSSLLWIHGKPGAGKSVLCSTIIEDIENICETGRASLAMYYHDFRENQKQSLRGLLSSVLFQLCDQCDSYYDILSTFHATHRHGTQSPSDDDLVRCLKDLLKLPGTPPVYMIIDGLDECPSTSALSSPREEVLSLLEDLIEARFTNLWICVSSRPEADIRFILEPLTFRSVSLHDERGQNEDIKKYIESIVDTNRNMQDWSADHKQLVIDVLTERADGMFRWAYCQLEYLADCQPVHIQLILDTLPATLDETYERTIREIKETKWEYVRRLLLCVSVASRPLRVGELAEILALDFEAGPIPKFREDWGLENPVEAVLSTCSTLLSVVNIRNSQFIEFAHFSVREFLTSARADKQHTTSRRYHISLTPAHTIVAQACLGILLHIDEGATRDSLAQFPLAEYAAEHWFEHARFDGVSQYLDEGMKRLFDRRKPHLAVWLWMYDPTLPSWRRDKSAEAPLSPRGTPLHYAAFCGLHDVVKFLAIEYPQDVNSWSIDDTSTPLHLASAGGHVELARLLVEHGADAEARRWDGETPLHLASEGGHVELTRLLVERADATVKNRDQETPLHLASKGGHIELARLLIEHGADAAAKNWDWETPLHLASKGGHMELAQLLVEHGASPAAQTRDQETPLHLASKGGHIELAWLLVGHGADAAAKNWDWETPLHLASKGGHMELARLLVKHGADAKVKTMDGVTPLHLASKGGHAELTRLLVEHGAIVAAQTMDEKTPLHLASKGGHVELARYLIEHGADAAVQSWDGDTPLHWASQGGHIELAQLLIEHGADVAAKTMDRWTPLHLASARGHVELARLLVVHGAVAAAQDEYGETPLHLASEEGHVELARLLVEHGADAAAQDERGWTSLHLASEGGHIELARLLIEHGANVAVEDDRGCTPLHLASEGGHVELARLLVADAEAQSKGGWTPLHQASKRGHLELTRLLVKYGANVAAQTMDGWTPLHLASEHGHLELARILIEHGADATAQDESDWTPLHFASEEGHLEVVQMLLNHGNDMNVENEDHQTSLFLASRNGKLKVVEYLSTCGADLTRRDCLNRTPLLGASENGHHDVTKLLLDKGSDVNAKDARLWTPLHMVSNIGNLIVLQLLLDRGADVEAQDDLHQTSLHIASQKGHPEAVQWLLSHGADVHTPDVDGDTALHLAAYYGHVKVTELLLKHGANIHGRNKEGEVPFDLALKEGYSNVVELLAGES